MTAVTRAIHSLKTDLQQCDQDGIRISVSWKALDEVIEQHADMLEALKELLDKSCEQDDCTAPVYKAAANKARAAIRRAESHS